MRNFHKFPQDLTGQVFGNLTVVCQVDKSLYPRPTTNRGTIWKCLCDCGVEVLVKRSHLVNGNTLSCGHRQRAAVSAVRRKHGHSYGCELWGKEGHRAYISWQKMKGRVLDKNDAAYHNYGGRGITIDPDWMEFENFYRDMGERPAGLTLERKDNNKGYSKDNCKWATRSEQQSNRRPSSEWTKKVAL